MTTSGLFFANNICCRCNSDTGTAALAIEYEGGDPNEKSGQCKRNSSRVCRQAAIDPEDILITSVSERSVQQVPRSDPSTDQARMPTSQSKEQPVPPTSPEEGAPEASSHVLFSDHGSPEASSHIIFSDKGSPEGSLRIIRASSRTHTTNQTNNTSDSNETYESFVQTVNGQDFRRAKSALVDKLLYATEKTSVLSKAIELERRFKFHNDHIKIEYGSQLLIMATLFLYIFRLGENVRRLFEEAERNCGPADTSLSLFVCLSSETALSVGLIIGLNRCQRFASKNQAYRHLYFTILAILIIYSLAVFAPPLSLPCDEMLELAECSKTEFHYCIAAASGCGMQQTTALMLSMGLMSLFPFVLPGMNHVIIFILAHIGGWLTCSILLEVVSKQLATWVDVVGGCILLSLTGSVSIYIKANMLRRQRKAFRLKYDLKHFGEDMFQILECMVPLHIVIPMLTNTGDTIAEQTPIASILFLVIDDFERMSLNQEPSELLSFLNDIFSAIDSICAYHGVTKIETVREEYVAAVGVLPKDKLSGAHQMTQMSLEEEHSSSLSILIKAAIQMLDLQAEKKVAFKMGIHTGPVVGGVLGNKLPRYRLFGDTMNTAARMMQKGLVSELQFGEATMRCLPPWVRIASRGPIEMKGKGMMQTFLLVWREGSAVEDASERSARVRLVSEHITESNALGTENFERFVEGPKAKIVGKMRASEKFATAIRATWSAANSTAARSQPLSDHSGGTLRLTGSMKSLKSLSVAKSMRVARISEWIGLRPKGLSNTELLEFHKEYYRKKMIQSASRGSKEAILILCVSGLEFLLFFLLGSWDDKHELFGLPRYVTYLVSRSVVLAVILGWWYLAAYTRLLEGLSIQLVEKIRTAIACIIILLNFLSYEALTPKLQDFKHRSAGEMQATLAAEEHRIRIWPLVFFFYFSVNLFQMRLPPMHTVAVVCFACFIVGICSRNTPLQWNFNIEFRIDQVFGFTAMGIFGIEISRDEQQRTHANFKLRKAISFTSDRIAAILDSLLPPLVVKELRDGHLMPCHRFHNCTILQSDLVGFTSVASKLTPQQVIEMIGELFDLFDDLTDRYGVYKMETVGDAYIAAQAEQPLTDSRGSRAVDVLKFAFEMVEATRVWSAKRGEPMSCRVGVCSGSCVGGVVGISMQRYHLFGSLLTVVEALEASSEAGKIHVSRDCHDLVQRTLNRNASKASRRVSEMPPFIFDKRDGEHLTTSKGDIVEFDAIGGSPSYYCSPSRSFRCKSNLSSGSNDIFRAKSWKMVATHVDSTASATDSVGGSVRSLQSDRSADK